MVMIVFCIFPVQILLDHLQQMNQFLSQNQPLDKEKLRLETILVKYVLKISAIFSSLFMISFFSTNVMFGELTVLSEKTVWQFSRKFYCQLHVFRPDYHKSVTQ